MNTWLKIGCFVTGYNYSILKNCSEIAKKTVKKYTAAMIIMCMLWGLVGYAFADRYLHATLISSLGAAALFILTIVQIERQIIMQTTKNNALQLFRAIIAVMMALIGSLIIDQIIFKDDIELEKEFFINKKVDKIYPGRAAIGQTQIDDLKQQLHSKDSQRTALNADIAAHPTIPVQTSSGTPITTGSFVDSNGITHNLIGTMLSTAKSQIPNPNIALLAPLDSQINTLQRLILTQGDSLMTLRTSIQKLLKEKTGFLDELNIMFSLIYKSVPALIVYAVWFALLLGLECFILMNKRHEKSTDYDALIAHQMDIHLQKLNILSGKNRE